MPERIDNFPAYPSIDDVSTTDYHCITKEPLTEAVNTSRTTSHVTIHCETSDNPPNLLLPCKLFVQFTKKKSDL